MNIILQKLPVVMQSACARRSAEVEFHLIEDGHQCRPMDRKS
jgi:hypothetical protein